MFHESFTSFFIRFNVGQSRGSRSQEAEDLTRREILARGK